MQDQPIPRGLCQCGCGCKTNISRASPKGGAVRWGEPFLYVQGHNNRGRQLAKKPDYFVDPESGCWVWAKSLNHGYGQKRIGGRSGRLVRAHRWYYEQIKGPVPEGLDLDHLCRNRACVNPDHLEPVTRAVNVGRGLMAKLTPVQVAAIRASPERNVTLAAEYGVDDSTISRIRSGKRAILGP